jgi:hypothetical protein
MSVTISFPAYVDVVRPSWLLLALLVRRTEQESIHQPPKHLLLCLSLVRITKSRQIRCLIHNSHFCGSNIREESASWLLFGHTLVPFNSLTRESLSTAFPGSHSQALKNLTACSYASSMAHLSSSLPGSPLTAKPCDTPL